MLEAIALAFVTVFVAELGDKSQLLALSFASRYRTAVVLAAVATVSTLTTGASVLLGVAAGNVLPTDALSVAAGLLFLFFAVKTWREPDELADETADAGGEGRRGFLAVVGGLTLAELGDKTMLATVALAATSSAWGVWIGAAIGMAAAGAVAVLLGRLVWKRLRPSTVRRTSAALFGLVGVALLVETVLG